MESVDPELEEFQYSSEGKAEVLICIYRKVVFDFGGEGWVGICRVEKLFHYGRGRMR